MNLLNQFRNYLSKQNISKTSIRNYVSDIRQYYNFLLDQEGLTPIAVEDNINHYLNDKYTRAYDHYLRSVNLSSSTIRRHLVSLNKFGQFLTAPDDHKSPELLLNAGYGSHLLGSGTAGILLAALILTLLTGVAIGVSQGRAMLAYELRQEITALGQVAGTQHPEPGSGY